MRLENIKASSILKCLFFAALITLSMYLSFGISEPLIKPALNELQSVQNDCVNTKKSDRTAVQKEHCKPQQPLGFMIPGIL